MRQCNEKNFSFEMNLLPLKFVKYNDAKLCKYYPTTPPCFYGHGIRVVCNFQYFKSDHSYLKSGRFLFGLFVGQKHKKISKFAALFNASRLKNRE